jgi:hypothetical protein
MRPDDVLQLVRRRPFEPFRIHISDGTVYHIKGPEMAMVERSTVHVGVALPEQTDILVEVVVSLLHITRLEPMSAAGPASPG